MLRIAERREVVNSQTVLCTYNSRELSLGCNQNTALWRILIGDSNCLERRHDWHREDFL